MGQSASGVRPEVNEAIRLYDWRCVEICARKGLSPDELKALSGVYNSEAEKFPSEQFTIILRYSHEKQNNTVLQENVKLRLWRSVGAFLKQGVHGKLRKWAVSEALNGADAKDLADILPYCTDDQFDECFKVALDLGIWHAVDALLRRPNNTWWRWIGLGTTSRASTAQRHCALTEAIGRADNDNLSRLILACADHPDVLDVCLKGAIIRGMWVNPPAQVATGIPVSSTGGCLQKGANVKDLLASFPRPSEKNRSPLGVLNVLSPVHHSNDLCQWALRQAAKGADKAALQDYLPLFHAHHLVKPVLKEFIKRRLWRLTSDLLLLDVDEDSAGPNTDQTLEEGASVTRQPPLRFDNDDDRIAFALETSVRRRMWDVVMTMLKGDCLSDMHRSWLARKVTEAAGLPLHSSVDTDAQASNDQLLLLLSLLKANGGK